MTPGPETAVDPLTVPLTPEARALFAEFTLIGIGVMLWARIDDRLKGLR